jgi:crotonobetaine/carnitine-CoA ligase
MNEYYGNPAATAEAFRDGWFHTGDLLRRDADGHHYFVSRLKDLIRRRGENISAFDVEQALLLHPDIVEVAAYGVPSVLTEEDVMVCVVARPTSNLTAEAVLLWAEKHLARHMWPRYVEFAETLPRTPTEKTAKYLLKARGVTENTIEVGRP